MICFEVISLGAGFDTTYFRLFSKDTNVKYVEIDLPHVVKKKINILLSNPETNNLLNNVKVENDIGNMAGLFLISDNYVIISQNLDDTTELDAKLKILGVDYRIPSLLLSECAITYMDDIRCTQLCKFLSEKFINASLLIYEQMNTYDGFSHFMMRHFEIIQSPLKALTRYNQVKHKTHYYLNNGWKNCLIHRVMDLFNQITPLEEYLAKIRMEPLDEWEEFHLTCLHYALYIASNGSLINVAVTFAHTSSPQYSPIVNVELLWTVEEVKKPIQRFSHCVMNLDNNHVALIGGIGVENHYHRKCSTIEILHLQDKTIKLFETSFSQLALTHIAGVSVRLENSSVRFFLLHGGCKSPSRKGHSDLYMIRYEPPSLFDLSPVSVSESSPKPCHRWRHTLVSSASHIYLFGGRTCDMSILEDVWMLELEETVGDWSGTWTQLDKGPAGRFSHASVSLPDGGFLISGGLGCDLQPLGDLWQWLPTEGWSCIHINHSIARYAHTCHLLPHRLVLVGGITFHPANPEITVVNLKSRIASHFSLPMSSPGNVTMLHNHESILLEDEKCIIVVGGGGNCFSFGTSFNKSLVNIPTDQFVE